MNNENKIKKLIAGFSQKNSHRLIRVAIFVGKAKGGRKMKGFNRQKLKNVSQGARLQYVREFRRLFKEDVADYFEFGGERKERTISRYENNSRVPSKERLEELAELYEVSPNAIKEYKYDDPIDQIYMFMWLEEQFPYYELILDYDAIKKTAYSMNVLNGIAEWMQMRVKRENYEITTDEYIEWKLNFEIINLIK